MLPTMTISSEQAQQLSEAARALAVQAARVVLPLSINTGEPLRVGERHVAKAFIRAAPLDGRLLTFQPQRLFVSAGARGEGAAVWRFHDIRVAGVSQFVEPGPIDGAAFATGASLESREAITDRVKWTPGKSRDFVELEVEYLGCDGRTEVEGFYGAMIGIEAALDGDTFVPGSRIAIASKPLASGEAATISFAATGPFHVRRLEVEGEDGNLWLVDGIRVRGFSLFAQEGSIPGDMFANKAIESFVRFTEYGQVSEGDIVEIDVRYVGPSDTTAAFKGALAGW